MQVSAARTSALSTASATSVAPMPVAVGQPTSPGAHGAVADFLRGLGAGHHAVTERASVVADQAMITPIESIYTATNLIKQSTSGIPGVRRATSLAHMAGSFGTLIVAMNASGMLRAPGVTSMSITHGLADMIDGRRTAEAVVPGVILSPGGVGDVLRGLGADLDTPEA